MCVCVCVCVCVWCVCVCVWCVCVCVCVYTFLQRTAVHGGGAKHVFQMCLWLHSAKRLSSRQARIIIDYLALVLQGHCHWNYTLVFLKNKERERERESIVGLSTLVSLSLVEVSFDRYLLLEPKLLCRFYDVFERWCIKCWCDGDK